MLDEACRTTIVVEAVWPAMGDGDGEGVIIVGFSPIGDRLKNALVR